MEVEGGDVTVLEQRIVDGDSVQHIVELEEYEVGFQFDELDGCMF